MGHCDSQLRCKSRLSLLDQHAYKITELFFAAGKKRMPLTWLRLTLRLLIGLALCHPVLASPLLRCEVTYAGQTHHLKFEPTSLPYAAQPVEIANRFLFKAVVLDDVTPVHVALYVYLQQEPRPYLLQHAVYSALQTTGRLPFTGEQHLYGGSLERELIYQCWLDD